MTAILHIGMHKTGTTDIQARLQGWRAPGIRYADLPIYNHSMPFRAVYGGGYPEQLAKWGIRPEDVPSLARRIHAEFSAAREADVVFSGEDIGTLAPAAKARLIADVAEAGAPARVVMYARAPRSFLRAAYQERIKNGAAGRPTLRVHYRKRLKPFLDAYGADRVVARRYDPALFPDGDVVNDFFEVLGAHAPPGTRGRRNLSLTNRGVRAMALLNRAAEGHSRAAVEIVRAWLVPPLRGRMDLPLDLFAPFVEPGEVRWLAEATGIAFDDVPSGPEPDEAHARIERILAAEDAGLAEMLRHMPPYTLRFAPARASAADLIARALRHAERIRWFRRVVR